MGLIERNAPTAVTGVGKNPILVSPSRSTEAELSSTAGIVDTRAAALSENVVAFAADRRISRRTLEALGVASGTAFFPELGRKSEGIFFRYADGWKARAVPDKAFVAGKGFKLSFWNLENVLRANPTTVYITEGEMDDCALVEAGISRDQVLSVPNGAVERQGEAAEKEIRGYGYVEEALKQGLSRVKKFVWCGDSDGPGRSLRSDMAKMLGMARFWFVEWPEGCKDPNDVLRHEGGQFLRELVTDGALPWPIDGLFKLSELPEPAPLTLWNPGFAEWESKIRLAPRTMSVVTGHPGHGKTQMFTQIWFNIVRSYCIPMAVASFETRAKPHIRRYLRTLLIGKLEKDMDDVEVAKADRWIEERYLFMVHPESRPTLKWFLDMAEVAVIRHGAKIVQLDPWNRLEASRPPQMSETEYIGMCLREFHSFCHDMNVHGQILAHPAKMEGNRRGQAPGLEDISGSKNWENMVDQGFVVYRPKMFDGGQRLTEAELHHRKARYEELGYPCVLDMKFKPEQGKYVSTDYEMGYGK
jgi:twinkle protein